MDNADLLPNDLVECQRLLLAAFREATQRERQVAELGRVLDETAASHEELKETHQATIDELNALKRWIYGRRRERRVEGEGQQHLFDLQPPTTDDPEEPAQEPPGHPVAAQRRRRRRELDLDNLPHYRHELDVPAGEKTCCGCGRVKDCIGKDETKILDYVPSKLEVHVHVRPKYACRHCKDGVVSPPPPERPIARGIAGPGLITQIVVSKFGAGTDRRLVVTPLSTGRFLCTSWRAHRSQHAVRLGQGGRRTVATALRSPTGIGASIAGVVDRRHPDHRAHRRQRRQPPGTLLDVHRRAASLLGVRFYRESCA